MNILLNRVKPLAKEIEVIDLFSGCGGLALGFLKEGFNIKSGIEIDEAAKLTASYNLHWKYGKNSEHLHLDITQHDAYVFNNYLNSDPIVIGGPPCQAYSIAGRAKLRSLGEDRVAYKDSRGFLYTDFIKYALDLNATAIVMENVPESTNFNGKNIPETVCGILDEKGYTVFWTILNAADFGVPQTRERVFVIAVKKEYTKELELPVPTHRPPNTFIRKQRVIKGSKFFRKPLESGNNLPYWVTVHEALSDLPELFLTSNSPYKLNKLNMALQYKTKPENEYQRKMRKDSFPNHLVTGHAFRKTSRDFQIFEKMKPGDDYLQAYEIAMKLFEIKCLKLRIRQDTEEYQKLKKKMVPPYSTEKFLSKWRKLYPDKPSHTLVAHLGTDSYSHIHPWEPRGISVREAARLQSFPDDFLFNCSMSDAFKQIGNAVPPLLSQAIAKAVKPYIE